MSETIGYLIFAIACLGFAATWGVYTVVTLIRYWLSKLD